MLGHDVIVQKMHGQFFPHTGVSAQYTHREVGFEHRDVGEHAGELRS